MYTIQGHGSVARKLMLTSLIYLLECPLNCICTVVQDLNGVAARSITSSLLPACYRPAAGRYSRQKGSLHLAKLTLDEHALGQSSGQALSSGQKPVHLTSNPLLSSNVCLSINLAHFSFYQNACS